MVTKGLAACALCVVLAGCESAQPKKPALRTFVPPPVERSPAPEPSPQLPAQPEIAVAPPTGPTVAPKSSLPPRPSNPQILMQRAERLFADGKRAVQEGRTRDARKSFDAAIQALMSEPLPTDLAERRRLEERLADLTDAIYHYDQEQLGAGLQTPESTEDAAAPPPVEKQILEENLPVNPELRDRVREQIEMTISELPLEVTDSVLGYINYFSTERGRKVLLSGFAKSGRYRDMIERVFNEEGLPEELLHVAQLESHFNPSAVSYAAAVGMWQFVRAAGTEYDLSINSLLDERRDPEQATRAAARYLQDLYRHYGDWYLALAAYNCGPGCVDRAIQRTGYADFWELRRLHALPLATTNYVPEILAMVIMYKNAAAYDLYFEHDPLLEYDNVMMDADTSLALVATAVDRPVGQIKQLNPALMQTVAPKGYSLHLPVGTLDSLNEALKVVPPAQRRTARLHHVEDGDTWASIAKKYGTTAAKLMSLNDSETPIIGAFALIPPPPAPAPKKKAAAKPAPKKKASTTASSKGKKSSAKTFR